MSYRTGVMMMVMMRMMRARQRDQPVVVVPAGPLDVELKACGLSSSHHRCSQQASRNAFGALMVHIAGKRILAGIAKFVDLGADISNLHAIDKLK